MMRRRFLSTAIAAVALGASLLGGANRAEAALRLTISSGGTTTSNGTVVAVLTDASNVLNSGNVTFDNYTVNIDVVQTNLPGQPAGGTLSITGQIATGPGATTDQLNLFAEVVTSTAAGAPLALFTVPDSSLGTTFTGQVGGTPGNSTSGNVQMTATVNGVNATSIVTTILPGQEANVAGATGPSPGGYTQTQRLIVNNLSSNSSSITVNSSQTVVGVNVVPEPGTIAMVLAGAPVLGLAWARRRKQV